MSDYKALCNLALYSFSDLISFSSPSHLFCSILTVLLTVPDCVDMFLLRTICSGWRKLLPPGISQVYSLISLTSLLKHRLFSEAWTNHPVKTVAHSPPALLMPLTQLNSFLTTLSLLILYTFAYVTYFQSVSNKM